MDDHSVSCSNDQRPLIHVKLSELSNDTKACGWGIDVSGTPGHHDYRWDRLSNMETLYITLNLHLLPENGGHISHSRPQPTANCWTLRLIFKVNSNPGNTCVNGAVFTKSGYPRVSLSAINLPLNRA